MPNYSNYGIDLSASAFQAAATKYRRELLMLPIIGLERFIKYMTQRPGVRYKEAVGAMGGIINVKPYAHNNTADNLTINERVLETHHGSVLVKFEPNSLASTVLANKATSADAMQSEPICRDILAYLAKQVSKGLAANLFTAKKGTGSTTSKLFDGFVNTLSTADGFFGTNAADNETRLTTEENRFAFTDVDQLYAIAAAMAPELKEQKTNFFVPWNVYDSIVKLTQTADYRALLAFFNERADLVDTLPGTNGNCHIVPVPTDNMWHDGGQNDLEVYPIAPAENMLIGFDQMSDTESITVKDYEPYILTFIMDMFFGTQFASVDPTMLHIVTVTHY